MSGTIFLDTAYAIALSAPADEHHERAVLLASWIKQQRARLVTTRGVLLEIGNALAKVRYRPAAIRLLQWLEADPAVEIVPLSEDLYQRALRLFSDRDDKEWSLVDCLSFVIMQDHGVQAALTTDEHFQQAGFRALMRDGVPNP
ncbi:MAG: type II toxin-antitoxin system VapC family toxin [Thermoanaerobaculia bacterium]